MTEDLKGLLQRAQDAQLLPPDWRFNGTQTVIGTTRTGELTVELLLARLLNHTDLIAELAGALDIFLQLGAQTNARINALADRLEGLTGPAVVGIVDAGLAVKERGFCDNCGEPFVVGDSDAHNFADFCSRACELETERAEDIREGNT